jgi:putative transposase
MDETYIKLKGKWVYLYRAINNNGFPDKVVMDKSGANYAGLATMIEICQVKYLNNIIGNYSAAENYRNITLRAVMIFYIFL